MKSVLSLISIVILHVFSPVQAASNANPVKGAELFKQCVACHNIGEGAENLVGPNLNHVFGRQAGSIEGANYSDAMKAKGESDKPLWNEKSLYIFLAGPARYVPGTIMGFEGFRKEKEIKDLLAFLVQYSPAYEEGSGTTPDSAAIAAATLPPAPATEETEEIPEFTEAYMASTDAISAVTAFGQNSADTVMGTLPIPAKRQNSDQRNIHLILFSTESPTVLKKCQHGKVCFHWTREKRWSPTL